MSGSWPFGALRPLSFDLIVADPPWTFDLRSSAGEGKAPQAHYECMPPADIKALPVGQLARGDAWLFLWASAPLLPLAFEVMAAWGFTYKSRIAWRKTTCNGKVRVGPGYVVRTMHEECLIGSMGSPTYVRALPSIFDGLAREHSRKPDEFYRLVEDFKPDAWRLDVFSRQARSGWDAWGREAGKFDEVAA